MQRLAGDAMDAPKEDSLWDQRATIAPDSPGPKTDEGIAPRKLKRARKSNPRWAKKLGYSPADFGCSGRVDSDEFAKAVATFQKANGLGVDGIAGPKTHRVRMSSLLEGGSGQGDASQLEAGVLGPQDELGSGVLGEGDELETGLLGGKDVMESGVLGEEDSIDGLLGEDDMRAQRRSAAARSRGGGDVMESGLLGVQGKGLTATTGDVHEAAAQGLQGPATTLPFAERIQASVGSHDLSGVDAHIGGSAAVANKAMGAEAYASGNNVAFAIQPSLHTAAHEAAHVVQQRGGVQLKDGVGERGDTYEKQADSVADAVVRGESAAAILYRGNTTSSPATGNNAPIQRWDGDEHTDVGNIGSKGDTYGFDYVPTMKGGGLQLAQGDLNMLYDWFATDELMHLAATPSPLPGRTVDTEDEVICALYLENGADPRFAGEWFVYKRLFDMKDDKDKKGQGKNNDVDAVKAVKSSVEKRKLRMQAANYDHFAEPEGKKSRGAPGSAGGNYRALHEQAIYDAYFAASEDTDSVLAGAFAREAIAQHMLADAFSAGHLRVPRKSIQEHWNGIHPDFHDNFVDFIVHRIAKSINDLDTNAATIIGSVAQIEKRVRPQAEVAFVGYPRLSLGQLFALLAHNVDGDFGLHVINDLGDTWETKGDGDMKESRPYIETAIRLGDEDIQRAFKLGKAGV